RRRASTSSRRTPRRSRRASGRRSASRRSTRRRTASRVRPTTSSRSVARSVSPPSSPHRSPVAPRSCSSGSRPIPRRSVAWGCCSPPWQGPRPSRRWTRTATRCSAAHRRPRTCRPSTARARRARRPGEAMTSAAAPAGTTARDRRSLPPFPEEVSLPATFGDWYDTAADALGRAERRDSGAVRLLAGAAMLAGVSAGVGLLAEPLVVLAGAGAPGETADVPSLVIGPVLALGVLAWWFWYRRDWGRARRLRHAWSRAVRDPRVLALP